MNVQTINFSTAKYITRKKSKNKRQWKLFFRTSEKTSKPHSELFEINYVGLFQFIPYYENHPRKYSM